MAESFTRNDMLPALPPPVPPGVMVQGLRQNSFTFLFTRASMI